MFQRFVALASVSAILACCTSVTSAQYDATSEQHSPVPRQEVASLAAAELPVTKAAQGRHVLATRAAVHQASNLTHVASEVHRNGARLIVSAFEIDGNGSNGAPNTVQPGIGVWNEANERIVSDRQINVPPTGNYTTAISNAGHDAPSVVTLADGSILVPYGAASTYTAYHPPMAWRCMVRAYCEPFKFAPAANSHVDVADDLSRSPEYLLPTAGLSELSAVTLGDATILAGQQQTVGLTGQPGAQGYVVAHARAGRAFFDTVDGPYDFRAASAPPSNGLAVLTAAPNDDAYVDFGIQSASGNGQISMSIGGVSCVQNVTSSSPTEAADAFVSLARGSCPMFRSTYDLVRVQYDPTERGASGIVGVTSRHDDAASLPPASAISLRCTGAIVCSSPRGADTVYDVRGSGLHRHGLFGGVIRDGAFAYYLMDVQQVTGSWYGPGHNSYALALACFRTSAGAGPALEWTDCSGHHPFSVAPGSRAQSRLSPSSPYLLATPKTYDPQMTPYVYDWSMRAQPPVGGRTYPVISSETLALLGNELFVAHGCQLRNGGYGLCYLRYDVLTGRTIAAGVIDAPPAGGSLAAIALQRTSRGELLLAALAGNGPKWGCSIGACALTYAYDARAHRWTRRETTSLGGQNDAGFVGSVRTVPGGFLYALKESEGNAARIVTFERSAP